MRPSHLPTAAALETLRQQAQAAVDAWMHEWGTGRPTPAVLTIATAINSDEWQGHRCEELRDESGRLWVRANAADRACLMQTIIGESLAPARRELIEEILDMAAAARAEELRAALFGELAAPPHVRIVDELPEDLFASDSGAVQLVCSTLGLYAIAYATHSSFWTTTR